MKIKLLESLEVPEGVQCEIKQGVLTCKKSSNELSKKIAIRNVESKVADNKIVFECKSGNKNDYKVIKAMIAHIKNIFKGLDAKFVYKLEACNVHFPMTLKAEPGKLIINNFLGEKKPRFAVLLKGVDVDVKGVKITVSSSDKALAGQTAANIEKATIVRNRDRRIFQDGIYITDKPEVAR